MDPQRRGILIGVGSAVAIALVVLVIVLLANRDSGGGEGSPVVASTTTTSGAPTSSSASTTTTRAATPDRCHTSQLAMTLDTITGAAGTEHAGITIRNASSASCTILGYVGVQLLDASGAPMPTQLTRDTTSPPGRLLLKSGDHAHVTLVYSTVNSGACASAEKLAVTPPDERDPLVISAHTPSGDALTPCNGQLRESPVSAGRATPDQ